MTGVTSCGGRTLNRKGENTVSWAVSEADPRILRTSLAPKAREAENHGEENLVTYASEKFW